MTKIIIKDDYGYNLDFFFKDNDNNVVDLTGLTITLKVREVGSTTTFLTEVCTIDSAILGTCYYTIKEGDFDTAGFYEYELEAEDSGVKLITAPGTELIKVKESIE